MQDMAKKAAALRACASPSAGSDEIGELWFRFCSCDLYLLPMTVRLEVQTEAMLSPEGMAGVGTLSNHLAKYLTLLGELNLMAPQEE